MLKYLYVFYLNSDDLFMLLRTMLFDSSKKNMAADTSLMFPHINLYLPTVLKQKKSQVEQLLFYLCIV